MWDVYLLPVSKDIMASSGSCKEKLGECFLACGTVLSFPFDGSLGDSNDKLLDFVSEVDAASLSRWRTEIPPSSSSGGGSTRSAACDGVDNLFATDDDREVYVSWSGRKGEAFMGTTPGDTSILPLARPDTWIGTRCIMKSVTATSAEATEDNVNGVEAVVRVLGKGMAAYSRFQRCWRVRFRRQGRQTRSKPALSSRGLSRARCGGCVRSSKPARALRCNLSSISPTCTRTARGSRLCRFNAHPSGEPLWEAMDKTWTASWSLLPR
jgi:hypothetical protein